MIGALRTVARRAAASPLQPLGEVEPAIPRALGDPVALLEVVKSRRRARMIAEG